MKRGKGRDKYAEMDEFERKARKNKKNKKPLNSSDEMEFQSWMNRPSDVDDYLEDLEEDFN